MALKIMAVDKKEAMVVRHLEDVHRLDAVVFWNVW
jgi:hypothetical protein